jgi:hypothetical protein
MPEVLKILLLPSENGHFAYSKSLKMLEFHEILIVLARLKK